MSNLLSQAAQARLAAQARVALAQMGIAYTEEKFCDAARDGDRVVVELFVHAGMNKSAAKSAAHEAGQMNVVKNLDVGRWAG